MHAHTVCTGPCFAGGTGYVQWCHILSAYQCDIQSYFDNPYLHRAVQDNQVTLTVPGLSQDYQSSPRYPVTVLGLSRDYQSSPRYPVTVPGLSRDYQSSPNQVRQPSNSDSPGTIPGLPVLPQIPCFGVSLYAKVTLTVPGLSQDYHSSPRYPVLEYPCMPK